VRKLEQHVALMQTAQAVLATAIPLRKDLTEGRLSGELRNYRWQVDIGPINGDFITGKEIPWNPELVKVRVRSPSGAIAELSTVRLMHKAPKQ
jgi:general secretion pathway protein I